MNRPDSTYPPPARQPYGWEPRPLQLDPPRFDPATPTATCRWCRGGAGSLCAECRAVRNEPAILDRLPRLTLVWGPKPRESN